MFFLPLDLVPKYCGEKRQYKSQSIVLQNSTTEKKYTGELQGKMCVQAHTGGQKKLFSLQPWVSESGLSSQDPQTADQLVLDWKMYLLLFLQDICQMCHHPIDMNCAESLPFEGHLYGQKLVPYHNMLLVLGDNWWMWIEKDRDCKNIT